MRTRPAWLSYAAAIKSKIEALPRQPKSNHRRDRIVYESYLDAKEQHQYPGTLGEWEFVVQETPAEPVRPRPGSRDRPRL